MFRSWGGTFHTVLAEGVWIENTAKNATVASVVATVAAQSMAAEKLIIWIGTRVETRFKVSRAHRPEIPLTLTTRIEKTCAGAPTMPN